jgi:hypothetical protein
MAQGKDNAARLLKGIIAGYLTLQAFGLGGYLVMYAHPLPAALALVGLVFALTAIPWWLAVRSAVTARAEVMARRQ